MRIAADLALAFLLDVAEHLAVLAADRVLIRLSGGGPVDRVPVPRVETALGGLAPLGRSLHGRSGRISRKAGDHIAVTNKCREARESTATAVTWRRFNERDLAPEFAAHDCAQETSRPPSPVHEPPRGKLMEQHLELGRPERW